MNSKKLMCDCGKIATRKSWLPVADRICVIFMCDECVLIENLSHSAIKSGKVLAHLVEEFLRKFGEKTKNDIQFALSDFSPNSIATELSKMKKQGIVVDVKGNRNWRIA